MNDTLLFYQDVKLCPNVTDKMLLHSMREVKISYMKELHHSFPHKLEKPNEVGYF